MKDIRTWLEGVGKKHGDFYDWAFTDSYDLPVWRQILRWIAFFVVDTAIWMIVIYGAIILFFATIGRFFIKKNEDTIEE